MKKKEATAEITSQVQSRLEATLPQDTKMLPHVTEIGEVVYVGDGICKIKGLPNARLDDMVRIQTKEEEVSALVLGLDQEIIETVVLGEFTKIAKGDIVRSSRRRVTIPVGDAVLGRVINPLGHPVDGKGELPSHKAVPIEVPAPAVNMREGIKEQVRTGVLAIDAIIPVGQGQRELCIGDRKTGKTTLMINIIKNQKGKNIHCVYVSIGGKKAKVKGLIESLEAAGALEYTTIVLATADDPPSLNYIAPYAGCAIAEYYMYSGQHAIIVYDDLSKQAKAYRQMSLLLKRSPGRDAYPGDIFYIHSRLLERAARLSAENGGGSLTAFPCAETQSGDISEYITTNLMSITDGHIYVDTNMLHAGIVPAIDSGASVSRIGGSIQSKLLRKLSEIAGGQLQRYNEVKSYENINTEITEETEREIKRGKRVMEMFNQPSAVNLNLSEEVILLFCVTQGKIDDMELPNVRKMKKALLKEIKKLPFTEIYQKAGSSELSLDDVYDQFEATFTIDYLQSLVSLEIKDEVEEEEKKKLNTDGLNTPINLGSNKAGTGDAQQPKANQSAPLDQAELDKYKPKEVEIKEPDGTTIHKESPIEELGDVINNIPEENPDIKVINI